MKEQIFTPAPNENSRILARLWKGFVNPEKRLQTYGPFFLKHLEGHRNVLLGAGAEIETVEWFRSNGFVPSCNEIDTVFREKLQADARREGIGLEVTSYYWQEFSQHFERGKFDAIVIDGNSLSCELSEEGRWQAVREFTKILPKNGVLIIDQRNYDYILRERKQILAGNFRCSAQYVYCGDKAHGKPIEISDKITRWEYWQDGQEEKGYLFMYPFKSCEVAWMVWTVCLGSLDVFSDFKPGYHADAEFFMIVAEKCY